MLSNEKMHPVVIKTSLKSDALLKSSRIANAMKMDTTQPKSFSRLVMMIMGKQ